MPRSGDASPKSWISPTTVTWFISFLFAAFGFWYGTNRDDTKALTDSIRVNTESIAQVRERAARLEARVDGLERRDRP